jgi:hypothetical protein
MTATELARRIRAKELSARDTMAAHLQHVDGGAAGPGSPALAHNLVLYCPLPHCRIKCNTGEYKRMLYGK